MKIETEGLKVLLEECDLINASIRKILHEPLHPDMIDRHTEMEKNLKGWVEDKILDGENPIDLYFEVKLFMVRNFPSMDPDSLTDPYFELMDKYLHNV